MFLYFIMGDLFLFVHITYFIPLSQILFPLATTYFSSIFMSLFSFCFVDLFFWFLGSDISEIPWYLLLSFCLISQRIIASRYIHDIGTWLWTVRCTWIAYIGYIVANEGDIFVPIMGWHRQLFSLLGIHFHASVCG